MNTRSWPSQAMTGSPEEEVRICASAPYGDVSPGYPGTTELWSVLPPSCERQYPSQIGPAGTNTVVEPAYTPQ